MRTQDETSKQPKARENGIYHRRKLCMGFVEILAQIFSANHIYITMFGIRITKRILPYPGLHLSEYLNLDFKLLNYC